jgi:hypothetical protein
MADDPKINEGQDSATLIKQDWQQRLAAFRRETASQSGSEAASPAPPSPDLLVNQAPPSLTASDALLPPLPPDETAGPLPGTAGSLEPAPIPAPPCGPEGAARAAVMARLEHLERQQRQVSWLHWAILGLLVLLVTTQIVLVIRSQPLDRQDQMAQLWAWGLSPPGSFGLALNDRDQLVGAELKAWLHRDLTLTREEHPGLPSQQAGQAQVLPPPQPAAAKVLYVGAKNSHRYHYPSCTWAKRIKPRGLITFTSVAAARRRHYTPCPTCKPPPLGPER